MRTEEEDPPTPDGVPGGDVPEEEPLSGTAKLEPVERLEVLLCWLLLPWALTNAGALLEEEGWFEHVLPCDPTATSDPA